MSLPINSRITNSQSFFPSVEATDLSELELFQDTLRQTYHSNIVRGVLNSLPKTLLNGKKQLTSAQKANIELSCHYFQMIYETQESFIHLSQPAWRLFHTFINRIGRVVFKNISTLDHEKIITLRQKLIQFASIIQDLLDAFSEEYAHRLIQDKRSFSDLLLFEESTDISVGFFTPIYNDLFSEERSLIDLLDTASKEFLQSSFDSIATRIQALPTTTMQHQLQQTLAVKAERLDHIVPQINPNHIHKQAELFQASREGETWALQQKELASQGKTINSVFFLKSLEEVDGPVTAVFKKGRLAGAMEAMVYDAAMIFHIDECLVPTKTKYLGRMRGSIQKFQSGVLGSDYIHEHLKELQENSFDMKKLPLRNFIYGVLPSLLFGNRDLHQANYFFQEAEDETLSILVFDNEFSFPSSNYVIKWIDDETWIPLRCCFIDFPHAYVPIEGDLRQDLIDLVQKWDNSFIEFQHYLHSPLGKSHTMYLPDKHFSKQQLHALKERIICIQDTLLSDEPITFRELVDRVYPCYHIFYSLTYQLHRSYTADWTGYFSCESLCKQVEEKGLISKEKSEKLQKWMRKFIESPESIN